MKTLLPIIAVALFLYAGSVLAAVNINTASAEALTDLPNIGPAKAAAIVKDREENGAYDSLDELTRVSGIGDKTVESLRGEAVVEGADDSDAMDSESSGS